MIESKKLRQLDNGNYLDSHGKEVRAAEYVALLVPKKQKWTRGEYMLGLQKSFVEIAKMGLSGEQMSVLMLLMAKTDFENYIHVTQDEMAKELDLKRPNVTRAVNALVNHNLIKKLKKGSSNYYLFNPEVIYKGQSRNYGNVYQLFNQD